MANEKKQPTIEEPGYTFTEEPVTIAGPVPGSEAWLQERVEVELFADDDKYSGSVFVGVNGKTYEIKRGVPVMVPRFVAQVLKNAKDQRNHAKIKSEGLVEDFKRKSAESGIDI